MQDLTKGSITSNVLKMTSFMLVSMVFQTLYFLVDLYFVGRLGREAVAGVSVSGNLSFIVLGATQVLGVGTTALIAHATGRKAREEARLVFNQSQILSLLVGLVFFVVMMSLRGFYARGLGADPATAAAANDYLTWFVPAMGLQFTVVSITAALRGTGNFKPGMVIQSGTVLLNIVLAPVLILGAGTGHAFGVAGAGMASFFSIIVGIVALLIYVVRAESYLKFAAADLPLRLPLWGRMLKIGLPAGAEFAILGVYMLIVYSITRRFGSAAQAAFGIGLRAVQAGFLPVVALGFAVSPVAGQNFGARLAPRVRETFRVGATLAACAMLVFTLVCEIWAPNMIGFFSKDAEVIAIGTEYLRIIAVNNLASGVTFVSSSLFQAMGNTMPSLITSFARIVFLAVPAILLSRQPGFELRTIWYLSVATVYFQLVLNLLFLRAEFRRRLSFAPTPAVEVATA